MCRSRLSHWLVVGAIVLPIGSASACADEGPKAADVATVEITPVLDGYCPSSYLLDRKAVPGDPKIRSTFRGEVYYHSSAERKKAFDANPVKYLPRLGGLCAAALGGPYANRLATDPRVFALERDRLYLFSSTRAMRVYLRDPPYYIERAEQRFGTPEYGGYCPVHYVRHGTPAQGNVKFSAAFQSKFYLFCDQDALDLFDREPRKYLPQYGGYCPMSMSETKVVPGKPSLYTIVDGRVFLFADEVAQSRFEKGNSEIIKKADTAWALYQMQPE